MATFEVSVTPKWKKKVVVEPSPILMLERFKGTPSLTFKDLSVGRSSTKGLWIQNSNDCTVTVSMTKLPPAERGVSFSETEFNLDALEGKRVEVTWLPLCTGTWRDVVLVQVWGLPPPHLNFRVVLHLTSVERKPKHKCCHVNPPLKARNTHSKLASRGKEGAGSCASCCKRNVKELHKGVGCSITTTVARGGGKENNSKIPPARLAIKAKGVVPKKHSQLQSTSRQHLPSMDEDSLEEVDQVNGNQRFSSEAFLPIEEGALLPPCSIPSTPIRRVTYSVQGNEPIQELSRHSPQTPVNTATFMISEEEKPRVQEQSLKFFQVMKELQFSPLTKVPDPSVSKATKPCPGDLSPVYMPPEGRWSPLPTSRHSSTSVGESFLNGEAPPKFHFLMHVGNENVGPGVKKCIPNQSSPIHSGTVAETGSLACPPQCSPIPFHKPPAAEEGRNWYGSVAGDYTEPGTKTFFAVINNTYTKVQNTCINEYHNGTDLQGSAKKLIDSSTIVQQVWDDVLGKEVVSEKEVEKLDAVHRAACIIQKNWRCLLSTRLAAKLRAERLEAMNRAACIIQKNWRRLLSMRLAGKLRAVRLEAMNRAACIIQKNWRRLLAMRLAAKLRTERLEAMNRAACIIQKNWKYILAMRLAAKLRTERLEAMNRAACIIQKNWRRLLAMRLAAKLRTERLEAMNRAACIIQKNWKYILAMRLAAKLRTERLEAMNRAACIIQKNWRRLLAMRLAAKLRAERLEAMNRAACIIQKNWRRLLAMRLAGKLRAVRLEAMNRAACIIQKNWRRLLAMRLAAKLRTERLEAMNRAACIIQKNWRRLLAMRLAAKLRTERLEAMNRAACIIQKNWRRLLAMRLAAKLRTERLEANNKAACIIQKNWRRLLAMRLAAKLRAERLEAMNKAVCIIQKYWRRLLSMRLVATMRAEKANDYSAFNQEFAMKVCSKFHLEMSIFHHLHRLASSLHPDEDVTHALQYIQNGLRSRTLVPFVLPQCDKETQTVEVRASSEAEFPKPKIRSVPMNCKSICEKSEAAKISSQGARRHFCRETTPLRRGKRQSCGGVRGGGMGVMSPLQRKLGQKDVPEKESWSSVAEAVGCTPRK